VEGGEGGGDGQGEGGGEKKKPVTKEELAKLEKKVKVSLNGRKVRERV